jgi:thiol-disulfide isomerase/thioredoxin
MVNLPSRLFSLLAAAAALAALASGLPAQVAPGGDFPPLAPAGLTGGTLPETAGKVLLVDFWASWCAPCKASFPAYARLNAAYAGRGLVIVAVSVDESASAYSAFLAKLKPPFVTLHDSKQKLVKQVQVPTMPTSYLVDRSGKVRFVHPGFHGEQTERELQKEIEALLDEKAPSP